MVFDTELYCQHCKKSVYIEDILYSQIIQPIGILINDENREELSFYFHHGCSDCDGLLKASAPIFKPYIVEKDFDIQFGTNQCEGLCVHIDSYRICRAKCKWAQYRQFFMNVFQDKLQQNKSEDIVKSFNNLNYSRKQKSYPKIKLVSLKS